MPALHRSRDTEWPPDPGGRTFGAARGMRVLLVALQGLVPAFAAALVWQPVDGPGSYLLPKAASLLITAAVCAGWFALGRRTWRESATVGPDAIVVRNVFRTCRVP